MSTKPHKHSKPNNQNHVIIIGGGHVGLSFALLLAHQGIYSTLIETVKYPTIAPDQDRTRSQYLDSRNTALSRKTVQIYQEIGLWEQLESHACRIDKVKISELGSFGKATLEKAKENVESFGQVMENAWLGRQLLQAVRNSSFVTLLDDTKVTNIDQCDSSVTITANRFGEKNTLLIEAPLAVACDGQNSPARQQLGIDVHTYDYQQVGIVGVVETDKPHEHIAIERFSGAGPLAILPLPDIQSDDKSHENGENNGYRRSVVFICPKGDEQRYLDDDEHFLATLQRVFGDEAGKFTKAGRRGAYPLVKVLAKRQVAGRCVIMGNAAHTLHPVAGQGFNLCLRDARALAMMLGNVLKTAENGQFDFGGHARLVAYEMARQQDQKRVIRFCDAVVHGFTHKNPMVKFVRNLGLIAFDKLPGIKPMVANYAMGLKS